MDKRNCHKQRQLGSTNWKWMGTELPPRKIAPILYLTLTLNQTLTLTGGAFVRTPLKMWHCFHQRILLIWSPLTVKFCSITACWLPNGNDGLVSSNAAVSQNCKFEKAILNTTRLFALATRISVIYLIGKLVRSQQWNVLRFALTHLSI